MLSDGEIVSVTQPKTKSKPRARKYKHRAREEESSSEEDEAGSASDEGGIDLDTFGCDYTDASGVDCKEDFVGKCGECRKSFCVDHMKDAELDKCVTCGGEPSIVFSVGDAVVNCRNLRGTITVVNGNGTYDLEYRDGQWDKGVSGALLRPAPVRQPKRSRSDAKPGYEMVIESPEPWKDTGEVSTEHVLSGKRRRAVVGYKI